MLESFWDQNYRKIQRLFDAVIEAQKINRFYAKNDITYVIKSIFLNDTFKDLNKRILCENR